jgi:hypothetical protein
MISATTSTTTRTVPITPNPIAAIMFVPFPYVSSGVSEVPEDLGCQTPQISGFEVCDAG